VLSFCDMMLPLFAQSLLDLQSGGMEGALRMVLVGGRCAEQCEDVVAGWRSDFTATATTRSAL
jgi:hypothetical protein